MNRTTVKQTIFSALLLTALIASSGASASDAQSQYSSKQYGKLFILKISKDFKMRGMKLSNKIFMGQAKVAGKYGLDTVVDEGSFVWGFNNRGVTIMKKF
jgi:hypothetical protein